MTNDRAHKIRMRHNEAEFEIQGTPDFIEKHLQHLEVFCFGRQSIGALDESFNDRALDSMTLKQFYKQKKPNNQKEEVLLIYYWLAKKEGIEKPSYEQIYDLFDQISIPAPKAIRVPANALAKEGLIISTDERGIYKIGLNGEEYIESLSAGV